ISAGVGSLFFALLIFAAGRALNCLETIARDTKTLATLEMRRAEAPAPSAMPAQIKPEAKPEPKLEPKPEPAPDPPDSFYYLRDDQPVGPITLDELCRRHAQGSLPGETLIARNGANKWVPLSTV